MVLPVLAAAGTASAPPAAAATAATATIPISPILPTAPTTTTTTTTSAPPTAYWLVARDGGVFTFGGARFYGSMGGKPLNKPVVGIATTPTGNGYWEVASDGGIFAFGDAQFYGSMGGKPLNKPVVGMAPTPTGGGYWEVASDGGIFAFGNAQFYGSMGGKPLNEPIVGMAATLTGGGYWEVASDGGIFTFGNAKFLGSMGGKPQSDPIAGMAASSVGGYWITNNSGLVNSFGPATLWGSAPSTLNAPVVGMASVEDHRPRNTAYPSGSYGYDISRWQCPSTGGSFPPKLHQTLPQIGIVQVDGYSGGQAPNPCLATEATWAGPGLGLYIFLTQGTATSSADPGCTGATAPACNYGYISATDAFAQAKAANLNPLVPWWLDVERGATPTQPTGTYWSTKTLTANAAVIRGALDGLHHAGVSTVGFYFSASSWNKIAGNYNPSGPLWIASWTVTPKFTCATGRTYWATPKHGDVIWPSGPVDLVQYTDNATNVPATTGTAPRFDGDYAC